MTEKLLGSLQTGIPFVISAPAGTGKTTLARMLVDEFPCIEQSISCTTRLPRSGEIEGKDYHFLTREDFEQKIKAKEFLEYAEVFGQYYGTLKSDVERALRTGKHILLVIDTQGAMQLKKKKYPATYIFISPPSLGELRSRLFQRKTEGDHHIEERLSWAEKELQNAVQYDYFITNDNLHRAYEILRSILISEEHKTERYHDRFTDK